MLAPWEPAIVDSKEYSLREAKVLLGKWEVEDLIERIKYKFSQVTQENMNEKESITVTGKDPNFGKYEVTAEYHSGKVINIECVCREDDWFQGTLYRKYRKINLTSINYYLIP